jgi:ATP-binding cassette subfamily C (CFTR/MRP) protein 4
MRLMNEIVSGIQVIKMYAWEKPFAKLVEMARRYVFWKSVQVSPFNNAMAIQCRIICSEIITVIHTLILLIDVLLVL